MSSGLTHLLFSFKGRIKRLEYNVAGLIVGLINSFFIYSVFSNSTSGQSSFFSIIALLSGIYVITALNVKRLHDLGKSGAWLLLPLAGAVLYFFGFASLFVGAADGGTIVLLISLILFIASIVVNLWSIWLTIKMVFFAGESGSNQYGDPPGGAFYGNELEEIMKEAAQPAPAAQTARTAAPSAAASPATPRRPTVQPAGFGRRGAVRPA
jgi:uncharacterized membrane protein YhaH (DUF805 family)